MKLCYNNNFKKFTLLKTQIELLKILASGITLKETAQKLCVKYNTIKTRTKVLYKKFNVDNRKDLISKAIELKILSFKDVKIKFYKRFCCFKENYTNPTPKEILTIEEIQYLKLASQGLSAKDIIQRMSLTGKYHAQYINLSLCYKLDAKNITQAVVYAKILEII